MKILLAHDYSSMSRKAANIISAQITLNPTSVLGLATGSTPLGIYNHLIKGYQAGDVDFSRVRTVNLDEYFGLDKSEEQSYYYFMHQNLFKDINIKPENTHIPDGTNKDERDECLRYNNVIKELGGVDLQLLGIGHNGHIGFNEPSDEFKKETHCVQLSESTIEANKRFFANADQVPRKAYTMGIKTIMGAKKIVVAASGADKANILYEAVAGSITPKVQASILQLHSDVTIVADEAALSKIKELAPHLLED